MWKTSGEVISYIIVAILYQDCIVEAIMQIVPIMIIIADMSIAVILFLGFIVLPFNNGITNFSDIILYGIFLENSGNAVSYFEIVIIILSNAWLFRVGPKKQLIFQF